MKNNFCVLFEWPLKTCSTVYCFSVFLITAPEHAKFKTYAAFGDRREGVVSSRTYFYEGEQQCDKNMEIFLNAIDGVSGILSELVQALISVQALVFDLAQLTCQKRFDCRNAILRSSEILLGTSYSQIVVAVLL